jgi:hypothetical protein
MSEAHFTQRLYFPYYLSEERIEQAKIPGMGRVSAAQLLWLDSNVDAEKVDYSVLPCYDSIEGMCKDRGIDFASYIQSCSAGSGDSFVWWKSLFTKPDQYGY